MPGVASTTNMIAFRTIKAESHKVELDVRHLQKRGPFGQ